MGPASDALERDQHSGQTISYHWLPWVFTILRTDFDHIKTENGDDSDAQTVLIWSKSVAKIARKIAFEIRKFPKNRPYNLSCFIK